MSDSERLSGQLGTVLITWNLINSAASVEDSPHGVDWGSIGDLSTLIDLFCLYDAAGVVGRASYEIAAERELWDALKSERFIRNIPVLDPFSFAGSDVSAAVAKHLAVFLRTDLDYFRSVRSPGAPSAEWSALTDHVFRTSYADLSAQENWTWELMKKAHKTSHLELGGSPDVWGPDMVWVDNVPARRKVVSALLQEKRNWGRVDTFVLRTFLYLAVADVSVVPFVPDTARRPVTEGILREEDDFRLLVASKLSDAVTGALPATEPQRRVLRTVSPLAAIVFERSQGRRDRVVTELLGLRSELAGLRATLHQLEQTMVDGSFDEAVRAKRTWQDAMDELELSFGGGGSLFTMRSALELGESMGEVVDSPTSYSAWAKAIFGLPIQMLSRLHRRRTLVGIHRLRRELPAAGRLTESIADLYEL